MAKKIIYINPGDMVDIRIIEDPEIQKNAREWNYQLRPKNILLHIIDYMNVNYVDPMIYFNNRICKKKQNMNEL